MKSLKRLFTSILPTSWVDDNDKKKKQTQMNSSFYENEDSLGIIDHDDNSRALST